MRLIDADELEEIVQSGLRENPHKDGFARVCHRTEYMHFLDVIRRMPTIAQPPNDPLTLEELREMDGEPVFVTLLDGCPHGWMLVETQYDCVSDHHGCLRSFKTLGIVWLAYRRKPEEGDNEQPNFTGPGAV